jgi:hypothetical protein
MTGLTLPTLSRPRLRTHVVADQIEDVYRSLVDDTPDGQAAVIVRRDRIAKAWAMPARN